MTNQHTAARQACEAYYFHAAIGVDVIEGEYFSAVRDDDRPNVWDFNRIFDVSASSEAEIDGMLASLASSYRLQGYNYFSVTPFTPPSFVARLALEGHKELTPIIQMVLSGGIDVQQSVGFRMTPVTTEDEWGALFRLVREDHLEGSRTQAADLDAVVTKGIVEGYRRKAGPCQFFLAYVDETLCGYGSATTCPNGMGMIEDLFTRPNFRKRGIASSLIARCVELLRQQGATKCLIGSLTSEPPKHLYRKLGFQPVCLTRSFYKKLTH